MERWRGTQSNVPRRRMGVGAVVLSVGIAFAPSPLGFDVAGFKHRDGTATASVAAFPTELLLSRVMADGMGFNATELGAGALAADHIRTPRPDTNRDMHTTVIARGSDSRFVTIEVFDAERMVDGEGSRVWNATAADVQGMSLRIPGQKALPMLGFDTLNEEQQEGALRGSGCRVEISKSDALKPLKIEITYRSGAVRVVQENFAI